MNQDRYPDMCMPLGMNAAPPRAEAPWRANPMKYQGRMRMDCIDHETEILDVELAHAYVPFQEFCPTFTPMASLKKGTAFPGLVDVYGWERRQDMGGEYI